VARPSEDFDAILSGEFTVFTLRRRGSLARRRSSRRSRIGPGERSPARSDRRPVRGGWSAPVRLVDAPGRRYTRWHIALHDTAGRCQYVRQLARLLETIRITE
jgi:hypothetical protein